MKTDELEKLLKEVVKLDDLMNMDKMMLGIEMCKFYGMEITPKSVLSGYCSFYR
jgi:hypothetical protein